MDAVASKTLWVKLHDQIVGVRCVPAISSTVKWIFRDNLTGEPSARACTIDVSVQDDGLFSLSSRNAETVSDLTEGDLFTFVMEAVVRDLVTDLASAVALHAGAVAWGDKAILLAGESGAGKSSLTSWFSARGFDYLTDEVVLLTDDTAKLLGFPRALVLKPGAAERVAEFPNFRNEITLAAGEHTLMRPQSATRSPTEKSQCGLIIFPEFKRGSDLKIHSLSSAETLARLVGCNLNARNLPDGGFRAIAQLARKAPAIGLRYGEFGQLDGTVDELAKLLLEGNQNADQKRRFLSIFPRREGAAAEPAHKEKTFPIPAPTPRKEPRKLTIWMATYDDYDGVYFSLQALRMYHPEILDRTDFLVVDNHPDGPCSESLKLLETHISNYRYVPLNTRAGTAIRDAVFEEATGKFVMCMDCHVFLEPGAIAKLLDYFDTNPDTRDLVQGPLVYDDLTKLATHFEPAWRGGMYGYWGTDERAVHVDAPPFDIPMQGLGLFACRRTVWPGFNPLFRGFGGEEGYIHEKFRQRGGRTLCLPFLRWLHRFQRPMGTPYRNIWEDRIRNYMLGFHELGLPTAEIKEHFRELLGAGPADRIFDDIEREFSISVL